jgi:serine/threonine-protein kinase
MRDRFELQQLLGQGGMGSVFVAQDRGLGRVVALKLLRDEFGSDQSALRRFVLEAQVGAQLEHPNIVPLYSFERTEAGAPAITMQLLEGKTMGAYIEEARSAPPALREPRGAFALKERIATLLGVCDAIHFAHERGVIHRDLKPDNVMLGAHHEVYVMDWGLARVLGTPDPRTDPRLLEGGAPAVEELELEKLGNMQTVVSDSQHGKSGEASDSLATRQGQVMGTPQYMPPEQALGLIDELGPAADQYSLGVMLLELATLRPARSHTNVTQALAAAVVGTLVEPVDIDGRPLHPALCAIIARATRVPPQERYPSVEHLAADLRRFVRDEPVSVYLEGPARRLVRVASRRPALATSLVAGLLLLGAAVVMLALVKSAREAGQRAHDVEGSRRVLVAVARRVQKLDVKLSELAAEVQAIAGAAVPSLELDGGVAPLRAEPVLVASAAYGGAKESFEQPTADWLGRSQGEPIPASAGKLLGLEPWLKRALRNGLPPAERTQAEAARNAALFAGHGALLRCFVGLEDGSFVQFPARETRGHVDVRQRPWYQMAASDPALHWTRPIVDVGGKTLRLQASVGLVGSGGAFLGVAGCDLRVASLARELALDLPGFRRAWLVTEDGKVAVAEGLEARVLSSLHDVNALPELPSLDDPSLAARLQAAPEGGYLLDANGRLIVHARLISPPWTYVAELDAAPYFSR